jgi:hypothetical protein
LKLAVSEIKRAQELARAIDESRGLTAESRAYKSQAFHAGTNGLPVLHLDDVSGIPFLKDILGVDLYQLRSRIRANTGDLFTATCPAMPDYDDYNRDQLLLGDPHFVQSHTVNQPIEVAFACSQGQALAATVEHARQAGGLVVHPYMGIEAVWALAADIQQGAGCPVSVLAPPPAITWFANDKCDVTEVTCELVGSHAIVDSIIGTDPTALADGLRRLARHHERVAIKMARCASAMGNHILEAGEIHAMEQSVLVDTVRAVLADKEWGEGEPVLAVAWEPATASPSTQLWIPPIGGGAPRLDGVYEQLLEGPEQVFLGSIPSRLGADINGELGRISLMIGTVYQALGYVGRCSFDFIEVAEGLKLTECNGRWGGTSTPMHLMDRLFPEGRPFYRAQDYVDSTWIGRSFADLHAALADLLYDARTGEGNVILYNVGCLPPFGKFDIIVVGNDFDEASLVMAETIPERLAEFA